MPRSLLARCLLLLVTFQLGCASIPEPAEKTTTASARALFDETAAAHGRKAFEKLDDISVSYTGEWYSLVQKLQGVLVDPDYRKQSEERLLLKDHRLGQIHNGPSGEKYVLRSRHDDTGDESEQDIVVRYNSAAPDTDQEVLDAAALVADAYRLFLLGPLYFIGKQTQMEVLPSTTLSGRTVDRLRIRTIPGLGVAGSDDFVLYIDRDDRLLRRVRFTLEGLASTRGAVVETDFSAFIQRGGVTFPTRFFERIRKPIPWLSAHRWQMTGLDVDRGMTAEELADGTFSGVAATPAQALSACEASAQADRNCVRQ